MLATNAYRSPKVVRHFILRAWVWTHIEHALVDDDCGSRVVITTRIKDVASAAARIKDVASAADDDKLMEIKPLDADDARQFFYMIAFRRLRNSECPTDLEDIAQKIVNKCEGLPLALVCVANLADRRGQLDLPALEDIHDRLTIFLQEYNHFSSAEDNDGLITVHVILDLSINYLPHYLRSCFLYCSVFPRGHVIKRKILIRLWVSAGFVEGRNGITMEEVAEKYLNQLIDRCLFQIVDRNPNGRVKRIKIHDLVHDVIARKSRRESFCDAYEGRSMRGQVTKLVRHLSLVDGENIQLIRKAELLQLRSFHVFSSSAFRLSGFCFKWLRILNLEHAPLKSLPHDVVYLFNLRLLSIRGTKIRKLPRGIGNLRNLEILDAINCPITFLPKEITKLENLRHLMASTPRGQSSRYTHMESPVEVPKGIWNLKNLQTLQCVKGDNFAHNFGSMTQIRTLHADVTTNTAGSKLCDSISSMSNLLKLKICAFTRPRFRDRTAPSWITKQIKGSNGNVLRRTIQAFRLRWHRIKFATIRSPFEGIPGRMLPLKKLTSRPQPGLQKLALTCRFENGELPIWFNSLINLTHLYLRRSRLQHDSIIQLDKLPKLVKLTLWGAYDGGILCIPPAWLPHLKSISLVEMDRLKTIRIGDNALQCLEYMNFTSCRKLKTLPFGIRNLTNLKELILDDMPSELVVEIRYHRDEIHHIPYIECWYKNDSDWKQEILVPSSSSLMQQQLRTTTGQENAESSKQSQEQTTATTGQEIAETAEGSQDNRCSSQRGIAGTDQK